MRVIRSNMEKKFFFVISGPMQKDLRDSFTQIKVSLVPIK